MFQIMNDKIWSVHTRMEMTRGCSTLTYAKYLIKFFMHLIEAFFE